MQKKQDTDSSESVFCSQGGSPEQNNMMERFLLIYGSVLIVNKSEDG